METFILKLVVAIIPLVVLVASVTTISKLSMWYTHQPLTWHRNREVVMKSIANKLIVAVIALIAMTAIIAASTVISKKVERCQSASMVFSQRGPEIIGNSYTEMMNTLFAGR